MTGATWPGALAETWAPELPSVGSTGISGLGCTTGGSIGTGALSGTRRRPGVGVTTGAGASAAFGWS